MRAGGFYELLSKEKIHKADGASGELGGERCEEWEQRLSLISDDEETHFSLLTPFEGISFALGKTDHTRLIDVPWSYSQQPTATEV